MTTGVVTPDEDTFHALARTHRVVPVTRRLLADGETPVGVYRKLAGGPGTFLLESAEQGAASGGTAWSRYSFVGVRSVATLTEQDGRAHWLGAPPAGLPTDGDPVEVLRATVQALAGSGTPATGEDLPPLSGGLVGYLGYDIVRRFERLPELADDDLHVPELGMLLATDLVVLDHYTGSALLVANAILDGECFQIVVAQRFERTTGADPLDVYRVLRTTNPSPYMYFIRFDGFDVVGSSPEAHLKVTGRRALLHPIAGTRWRGATPDEDARLAAELLADPKEKAEHVMLVDLGRNDLGRVCKPGTVHVPEFATIERYSHVMHIVSTVVGELADEQSAFDALVATFPAGTLSGAPKVRAMEIIEELEPTRRGLYGGIVGYFGFGGDLDTAIAIRTALIRAGVAYVQAGGGIVADSDPAAEEQETRNKAAAVLTAIAAAETLRPAR